MIPIISVYHIFGERSMLLFQIGFAPFCQFKKSRQQGFALLCQGIFHSRGNFIKLFPMDDAKTFQIPQSIGQHGVGDTGHRLFQFHEAARWLFAKLKDDMRPPFSTEQFQCPPHGAILPHFVMQYPLQIFFRRQILFHTSLRYPFLYQVHPNCVLALIFHI